MSVVFFVTNILVGLEIDYTCLGGSWNGKVWEMAKCKCNNLFILIKEFILLKILNN